MSFTLSELKVGSKGLLVVRRQKGLPLGNVSQQELDGDTQFQHRVPKPGSGILRRFTQRLHQMFVRLRVVELNGIFEYFPFCSMICYSV